MNAHCSHSTAQQIQTAVRGDKRKSLPGVYAKKKMTLQEQLWRLNIGVSVILDVLGYRVCLLILLRRAVLSCRSYVFMYQSCAGHTGYLQKSKLS